MHNTAAVPPTQPVAAEPAAERPPAASLRSILGIFLRQKTALVGLLLIVGWVFVAVAAPLITRYDPLVEDSLALNQGPSSEHWLGTDHKGRDLWSRLAYGSRLVLGLAPLSVLGALIVGTTIGLVGGYYGGWIDENAMRLVDAILAFPTILLYLIIIVSYGPSALNVVRPSPLPARPALRAWCAA